MPTPNPAPPPRPDLSTLVWHGVFVLLMAGFAGGLLLGVVLVLASLPALVMVFPITLTLAAVALAILYWRHRRARARRALEQESAEG